MKKTDTYKIGVKKTSISEIGGGFDVSFYCSCGNKRTGTYLNRRDIPVVDACPDCGNDYFLENIPEDKRTTEPFFKVISKTSRGFEIERTNLSMIFHSEKEELEVIRPNMIRRLIFDYVDAHLICYRNGEVEYDSRGDSNASGCYSGKLEKTIEERYGDDELQRINSYFLRKMSTTDFVNEIGTESSKYFYSFIDEKLQSSWGRKDKKILFRLRSLLKRKEEYDWAQILSSAGFKCLQSYEEFYAYGTNRYGKTPAEIMGVPKFTVKYLLKIDNGISYSRGMNSQRSIRKVFKNGEMEANKLSELLQLADENNMLTEFISNLDTIQSVIKDEKYNLKRLMEYLISELPMYQGITSISEAVHLMRDYMKMSKQMSFDYEKYPRSLKKAHDIAMVNYRAFKNDLKQEDFFMATSAYKDLEDIKSRNKYVVIIPEKPEEVVQEGNSLHHCIASYLTRVQEGKTQILFMREKENLDKPLVSIEVKDGRVVQARGMSNRSVTLDEKEYLEKWAKKKGIAYA